MKLFIPTIGQILELEKEWTVDLQDEYRNRKMIEEHGSRIVFPVGTRFAVDRIYIRQNAREFDSVTFRIVTEPKGRFWVKLAKANEIEFNFVASKIEHHELLYKGKVAETSSSLKGLMIKLKKTSGYGYYQFYGHMTLKKIFYKEVIPHMTGWNIRSDYEGNELRDTMLATDVETKTHVPLVSPVDKTRFNKLTPHTVKRNKDAGKMVTVKSFFGSVNTYKNPSEFWEVEPTTAITGFNRDFMKTLRDLKKVKTDDELLQHLPADYEYRIRYEDN